MGIGQNALARAVKYAQDRVVFDRPIGQNQSIQHPLAESWREREAAYMMGMKAGSLYDKGLPWGAGSKAAKELAKARANKEKKKDNKRSTRVNDNDSQKSKKRKKVITKTTVIVQDDRKKGRKGKKAIAAVVDTRDKDDDDEQISTDEENDTSEDERNVKSRDKNESSSEDDHNATGNNNNKEESTDNSSSDDDEVMVEKNQKSITTDSSSKGKKSRESTNDNMEKTAKKRTKISSVKVEKSIVVRESRVIDSYVKKNNKLDEDDMIEKKHYRKTINYLLNKKVTAEKELVKLTTVHSVDIKAKAMKHLNERMVEYVNQVLARNSLRYEIMYPTAAVNILSCLCF